MIIPFFEIVLDIQHGNPRSSKNRFEEMHMENLLCSSLKARKFWKPWM
jgi:hypothetical protein